MSRPHIALVEGNVKRGVDRVKLGPRTLVVGANGVGKTSIVHAVELLLTGGCGKVGKLPARLLQLATGGGDASASPPALNVRGELSDGHEAAATVSFRVVGKKDGGANKPLWALGGKTVDRPLGAALGPLVSGILRGDPTQTLRPELIRVACGKIDIAALAGAHVIDAFRAAWDGAWSNVRATTTSDADALATLAENLRAEAKEASKASTVAVPEDVPPAPSDDEIAAARARLTAARDFELERASRPQLRSRDEVEAELSEARELLQPIAGEQDAAFREQVTAAFDAAAKAAELHVAVTHRGGKLRACIACGQEVDPTQKAAFERWTAACKRANDAARSTAELREQLALRKRIAELESELAEIEVAERAAEDEAARCEPDSDYDDSPASSTVLEAELLVLLQRKATADAAQARRTAAAHASGRVDLLRALSKAADAMVAAALETGIRTFEARVNRYLVNGTIRFKLFEQGKPVCKVVWRGGAARGVTGALAAPLQTLSGAQEADVVRAIACAWAAHVAEPVSFLAVDDVWFDKASLLGMLRGFPAGDESGPAQVIVCAVDDYGIEAPDGWAVVRL